MFPVRVLVETVRAQHCLSCAHDGHILLDTYAIICGGTQLNQLVDTVLSALGHSQLAAHAKGLIQVNNWKALPFDQLTDNVEQPVENLFKDIASHITLRILTKPLSTDASSTQCITELKQRLLKTALSKQPQILASVDNQQIKDLISQVIAGDDPAMLNADQIAAISEWLEVLDQQNDERRSPLGGSTRFHQVFEVPKLEKWFKTDASPSRQRLIFYMNELNSAPHRRTHTKITYQQICNWFSNARAARKRPNSTSQVNSVPLPISSVPDFKAKFDLSAFIDKKTNGDDLIDGADSPAPAEEGSVHSNSDNNDDFKQECTASSPELSVSVTTTSAPSPKPQQSPGDLSSVGSSQNPSRSLLTCTFDLQQQQSTAKSTGSRLMFDPLTELPVLEKWFEENPHPTWMQIDQYTNSLNSCPYRENYPHISQHNVKIWFKNRRAKCKRMQTTFGDKLHNDFYHSKNEKISIL